MTDYADLVKRLRETLLRERNEALKWSKSYEREAEILTKDFVRVCAERDAAIARADHEHAMWEKADEAEAFASRKCNTLRALLLEAEEKMRPFADALERSNTVYAKANLDDWTLQNTTAANILRMADLRALRDCQKKIEEMVR